MSFEPANAVWLSEDNEFSLTELVELSGVSESELRDLVELGAVTPLDPEASLWLFNGKCLLAVRTAHRLRLSFDLEPHAIALVVSLLDRIHGLEAQIGSLRAQQPRSPLSKEG
jgi:hypothetical protein